MIWVTPRTTPTAVKSGVEIIALYKLQCKTVFKTYLSLGRSNQKVEESGLAFFGQIGLEVTFPTQIQIHKYTNTQIHKYSILQSARKTHHVVYF